jgi:hypothetical protein
MKGSAARTAVAIVTISLAWLTATALPARSETRVNISESAPSALALNSVPRPYLTWYQRAAHTCSGLSWPVLAGVGEVESDHGQSTARGVHYSANFAGAEGPMQFEPATFAAYAVKADPDHQVSVYDPEDAIFAAARMLCADGAASGTPQGVTTALLSYDHVGWYPKDVLSWAAKYATSVRLEVHRAAPVLPKRTTIERHLPTHPAVPEHPPVPAHAPVPVHPPVPVRRALGAAHAKPAQAASQASANRAQQQYTTEARQLAAEARQLAIEAHQLSTEAQQLGVLAHQSSAGTKQSSLGTKQSSLGGKEPSAEGKEPPFLGLAPSQSSARQPSATKPEATGSEAGAAGTQPPAPGRVPPASQRVAPAPQPSAAQQQPYSSPAAQPPATTHQPADTHQPPLEP